MSVLVCRNVTIIEVLYGTFPDEGNGSPLIPSTV